MKIQQLRYFVSVADKGSVRAAAETLGVSPAAVSQALRELESALGTPLLTRETHGAAPSFAGRQLLVHARLILGQIDRAEEEIALIKGMAGGKLSIGITPWVAQAILPHALAAFRQHCPEMHIEVSEALGSAHPLLRDGTLDLVIGRPPPSHLGASFHARDLFSCGLAVVGRRGHPLAGSTSLRELGGQDWVLTVCEELLAQPLSELLTPHGVTPAPHNIHFARSALTAFSMLEVGNMLTLCPWPLVECPLLRDRMQALPIREKLPELTTSIVFRRSDTLSSGAQQFLDCFEAATAACLTSEDPLLKRVMNSVEALPARPAGKRADL